MKKKIGLDIKPPEKSCQDSKCAWHGNISIRGQVFKGTVRSVKGQRTAVIEWPYNQYIPKYERYERRTSYVVAHNPDCIKAREGNKVIAVECRPLSKTKSAVIVGIEK
jgi:small subunit ribosomal protein S17